MTDSSYTVIRVDDSVSIDVGIFDVTGTKESA